MLKTQCRPVRMFVDMLIDQEYTRAMKIRKAYKFRLKPNKDQLKQLDCFAGHCRFLWNKVLNLNLDRLQKKQPIMWYFEADFWSKIWKSSNEYSFLKEVPAHCLQQKLKDLDKAFRDAFDKTQPLKRLPAWKKRGQHDSFRFPQPAQIQLDNRRVKLPKLGWIGFYKSNEIKGELKNVTVSKHSGHWYVSFQVESEESLHSIRTTSAVGIDVGIKQFAMLSNGMIIKPISSFKQWEKRLAKAQRKLAKKEKFSNNWKKQKEKIKKIHSKISRVRHDYLHKISTQLCNSHAMIVVEDLKLKNMTRSAKGKMNAPGTHVKAKSGLNKSILDQGFGEFRRQLEYKLGWRNGLFLKINPQYTSQRCSHCSYVDKDNRTSQEKFLCQQCGNEENADFNAAKNILAAGHAVLACGEVGLPTSMKQEPLRTCEIVAA